MPHWVAVIVLAVSNVVGLGVVVSLARHELRELRRGMSRAHDNY